MTTNVVNQLMEELDANPALLEAVRSRLLTRELLELPQTVNKRLDALDALAETANKRLDKLEDLAETANKRLGALEALVEAANKRLDNLEALMDVTIKRLGTLEELAETANKRLDRLEELVETANKRLDRLEELVESANKRLDRLESIVRSMHTDVGKIRGVHAYQAVRRDALGIAREMGFRATEILSRMDLLEMIEAADTDDVSWDDLRSFRRSDLIMRGENVGGGDFYIALEVSFTVHWRDRRRAVRNAELLTSFTGVPAFPVVAGLQINAEERQRVERGELRYYEIEEAALLPE